MKVRRQLEALEPMVLGPLGSLPEPDWHRAPAGKWTIGQIVDHLGIGVDLVAEAFEQRAGKGGMKRRASPKQSLARHLVLSIGKIPSGRDAPELTVPEDRTESELVAAQFRMGVERLAALVTGWPEPRQVEVFVRHPLLGDLNLPEWVRFHHVHCRHHAGHIKQRLAWLAENHT